MNKSPLVMITIGDPASSGPELSIKTALDPLVRSVCRPIIIGSPYVIEDAMKRIQISHNIEYLDEAALHRIRDFHKDSLQVYGWGNLKPEDYEKGSPSAVAGEHIVNVSKTAAKMALENVVDAICSGPSSKVSLNLAGYPYEGMTDVFLEILGYKKSLSMLVLDNIRVVISTGHIPFSSISSLLTIDRIIEQLTILRQALIDYFSLPGPKIGLAALNPHASDNGLYGAEESEILYPAIRKLGKQGIIVYGPVPADFLIPKIQSGNLDGGLMLYHDQANIPLKAIGLFKPATLLLGLPIIRTSVAHGTVFGKAKSGTADPIGMINACKLAAELAIKRRNLR